MTTESFDLINVPTKPKYYVSRSEEKKIIDRLVSQSQEPTQSLVVLYGLGGYGKSTLAKAICHNSKIKEIFAENIYWIKIGDRADLKAPDKPLKQLSSSPETVHIALKEKLRNKRCLVVLDNLKKEDNLKAFLEAEVSPYCVWLITTQNQKSVLPSFIERQYGYQVRRFRIDEMKQNEAFNLLKHGLQEPDRNKLQKLADRLYEFPLLITLAKSIIDDNVDNFNLTVDKALDLINKDLSQQGVSIFDEELSKIDEEDNPQVSKKLSIFFCELLSEDEKKSFMELSIFPPGRVRIPMSVVGRLWNQKPGDTQHLCRKLYKSSLLEQCDLEENIIVLKDFLRRYCLEKLKKQSKENSTHERLIKAYENLKEVDLSEEEEIYLRQYLLRHWTKAGRTLENLEESDPEKKKADLWNNFRDHREKADKIGNQDSTQPKTENVQTEVNQIKKTFDLFRFNIIFYCFNIINSESTVNNNNNDFKGANFPGVVNLGINEGTQIGTQNNHAPDQKFEVLLTDFKQFIDNLQQEYPNATDDNAYQIIDVKAKEIKNTRPSRWQNFMDLKRLWNGGKKAAIKVGEHFVEQSPWGKGAIAFLEGVVEEPK